MGTQTWSSTARSIWGKTERAGHRHLPLVQHLEDSAAVAGQLWDHWLSRQTRDTIARGLGSDQASARLFVVWSAGLHDVGKASPGFTVLASHLPGHAHLLDAMAREGLVVPAHVRGSSDRLPPHAPSELAPRQRGWPGHVDDETI